MHGSTHTMYADRGRRSVGLARGVTLIDTIVGIALLLIVFLGIAAAFELSVQIVTNNKARSGAIALAEQQMEYVRSLSYAAIGTVGGVPAGNIPQSQTISLNGVTYVRRTVILYEDDPMDGTGAQDQNGITTDYKAVKVDVSWIARAGTEQVDLVSRFSPATGLETNPCSGNCGTLVASVVNSLSAPVAGASVTITNPSITPAVNFSTFTNASGTVTLLAAPGGSGYLVTASNPGYTSATSSSLTVSNNQTTSATLAIDSLSSITVITKAWGTDAAVTTVPFTLTGNTYGYSSTLGGSGSATTTVSALHWDSYTFGVAASTGYDLAYTCEPEPVALSAGTATTTTLYLVPHAQNSLAVEVEDGATGALLPSASVQLTGSGYAATQTTDSCGQTYFGPLTTGTYMLSVSMSGYSGYTNSNLSVSSSTQAQVLLH